MNEVAGRCTALANRLRPFVAASVLASLLVLIVVGNARPAYAASYVVDKNGDSAGDTACTGAANDCSLRGALSNAAANAGADTITFDASKFPPDTSASLPAGQTITIASALPALSNNGDTVDAVTASVAISASATGFSCLTISGNGNVIKGIDVIMGCSTGFTVTGSGNTIGGANTPESVCTGSADEDGDAYVNDGCPAVGAPETPNQCANPADNDADGSTNDGCPARGEGMTIKVNTTAGVSISGEAADTNVVAGNFIGTGRPGDVSDPNGTGVVISGGADGNTIGGITSPGFCTDACNVISGNSAEGVFIKDDGTTGNVVSGNFVGIDAAGTAADLGNSASGVYILRAQSNTIGGTSGGLLNVISGNHGFAGVTICGNATFCGGEGSPGPGDAAANVVQGNYIGTNPAGTSAIANTNRGVAVDGAPNVVIGGAGSGRNIISGNGTHGIILFNATTGAIVRSNYIGTNKAGTGAIPNLGNGVTISAGAYGNTIGGSEATRGNVISGNNQNGVAITGAGTTGNFVRGNYIGTTAAGTAPVGNGLRGVLIESDADGNTVGGTTGTTPGGSCTGACNVLSGNIAGVAIIGAGTDSNTVKGNFVGTDATGMAPVPNTSDSGVFISFAPNNTIGGSTAAEGNLISGNTFEGILIAAAAGNVVKGNNIGSNSPGTGALANGSGIRLDSTGLTGNTVGGISTGEGNRIANNTGNGVCVTQTSAGNSIRGNSIYANGMLGIDLDAAAPCPTGTVTANDAGDGDTGPNNLMNFPVITSATFDGTNTTISGTLDTGIPAEAYVDVYATDSADPSGYGEGRTYLGTAPSPGGAWSLTIAGAPPYSRITATATDNFGTPAVVTDDSTSEFSAVYTMTSFPGAGIASTAIAYRGQTTPIGSSYNFFGPGQVPNTTGEVVFWSSLLSGTQGIFRWLSGSTTKYVATGDAAPGGGTFTDLADAPVVNASGDVVFWAATSAPTEGIYLRASGGAITKLVGVGDAAPGGSSFLSFDPPILKGIAVLNNLGDVSFWASLASGGQGIYLRKSDGTLLKVAATGDTTPAGGTFSTFLSPGGYATVPIVTENQEVAFRGFITGGPAQGIFVYSEGRGLTKIAAFGDVSPAGGTYSFFGRAPSPNDSGQVAFWASLSSSSLPSCPSVGLGCGIFVWDDGVTTKTFASGDSASPQTGGLISDLGQAPFMNDSGQITVWAGVTGGLASQAIVRYTDGYLENVAAIDNSTAIGGTFVDFIDSFGFPTNPLPSNQGRVVYWGDVLGGSGPEGIFITQASASQVVVVPGPVAGATAPGTNGGTFGAAFDLDISSQGEAVFANTVTGGTADSGIFLFFAGEPVRDVALEGQAAPGGGTFDAFEFPVNNDNDQIVARATTTGGPAEGLYLFFAGSAERMAAAGQTAPGGGGATYLFFAGSPSINNSGQVASTVTLNPSGGGLYLFFAGSALSGLQCQSSGAFQQCRLASLTDTVPGGGTYLFFAGSPSINDSGWVAQRAGLSSGEGVYLFFAGSAPPSGALCNPSGSLQQCKLGKTGDAAPGGGTFNTFGNPAINSNGQVVASATVNGGTNGLFLFFAGQPTTRLASVGDSAAGSTISSFTDATINDSGVVVARATLADNREGLFLFFAGNPAVKVAAQGDAAATGSGTYSGTTPPPVFPYFAMNNGARVVFVARISGASTTQGVFFASLDTDGDGVMDFLDNCPTALNTDQNNTDAALRAAGWNVVADELGNACDTDDDGDGAADTAEPITCRIAADCDSDGFFDGIEDHVGTDPTDRCADTTTPYDERGPGYSEPLSPRPVDINDDRAANLTDILTYIPVFNQNVSPANVRYDIKQDSSNKIALADILAFIPFFGQTCTP